MARIASRSWSSSRPISSSLDAMRRGYSRPFRAYQPAHSTFSWCSAPCQGALHHRNELQAGEGLLEELLLLLDVDGVAAGGGAARLEPAHSTDVVLVRELL